MESVIKWQTGTPNEGWGTCVITTISGHIDFAEWEGNKWDGWPIESIAAWCYIGNIEPYKENKEFKVGDIVLYEGPLTKGIMIIGSFDYGGENKFKAARAVIGESISIKTGSSAIYPNFSPSINNIRHATDDEVIDFVNKEGFQGYLNFYKDWLLKNCSRLVNLGLLNKE